MIRSYSAYLTYESLDGIKLQSLLNLFRERSLSVDVTKQALEFEFTGKDLDKAIVNLFKEVAIILYNSTGELRCEVDVQQNDPQYEFYKIIDGRLLMQKGAIVRSEKLIEAE